MEPRPQEELARVDQAVWNPQRSARIYGRRLHDVVLEARMPRPLATGRWGRRVHRPADRPRPAKPPVIAEGRRSSCRSSAAASAPPVTLDGPPVAMAALYAASFGP